MVQDMGPQTMRAAAVGQNVPLSFLHGHSQERKDQLSVILSVHGDCEFHKFPDPAHRIPLRPERVVNINQLMLQLPSCEGKTLLVAQTATYQMDEFTVTLRNSTWRNFHGWAQTAPSPLPDSKDTAPCSPPGHQKDNWTHFPGGLDIHSGYPLHPSNARLHCNRSSSQTLLPKCQSVQKDYSPFHCYLFHNYVMMFLIILFILLLLWCYFFCNKQYPHPTRCCVAQKPAFLGSHDERIVFCLWVSLKRKKRKKKRTGLWPSNLHIVDSHPSCQPWRRQPVNPANLINYRLIQQSTLQSWAILRKAKWATIVSVEILVKWPKCLQPQFPHPLKVISLLQGLLWVFKVWHTEDTSHPSLPSPQLLPPRSQEDSEELPTNLTT